MPLRPEVRKHYGYRWQHVTRPAILKRFGGIFDEAGDYLGGARCARCGIPDVMVSIWQRSQMECAHLSGNSADDSEANTACLCHKCHRANDYAAWIECYRAWWKRQHEAMLDRLDSTRPILVLLQNAATTPPAPDPSQPLT